MIPAKQPAYSMGILHNVAKTNMMQKVYAPVKISNDSLNFSVDYEGTCLNTCYCELCTNIKFHLIDLLIVVQESLGYISKGI